MINYFVLIFASFLVKVSDEIEKNYSEKKAIIVAVAYGLLGAFFLSFGWKELTFGIAIVFGILLSFKARKNHFIGLGIIGLAGIILGLLGIQSFELVVFSFIALAIVFTEGLVSFAKTLKPKTVFAKANALLFRKRFLFIAAMAWLGFLTNNPEFLHYSIIYVLGYELGRVFFDVLPSKSLLFG